MCLFCLCVSYLFFFVCLFVYCSAGDNVLNLLLEEPKKIGNNKEYVPVKKEILAASFASFCILLHELTLTHKPPATTIA